MIFVRFALVGHQHKNSNVTIFANTLEQKQLPCSFISLYDFISLTLRTGNSLLLYAFREDNFHILLSHKKSFQKNFSFFFLIG